MCCPEAKEIPGVNMNFSGGWDLSAAGLEDTKETEKAIFWLQRRPSQAFSEQPSRNMCTHTATYEYTKYKYEYVCDSHQGAPARAHPSAGHHGSPSW